MRDRSETGRTSTDNGVRSGRPAGDRGESSRLDLILYLIAGVIYIFVGFLAEEVFAWWSYGVVWLVAVVWLGPPAIHHLRKRFGKSTESRDHSP